MLTKSGLGALVAALAMIGGGFLWRYPELITVGAGLLGLVVVSVIAVRARQPARVSRVIPNPRAARGTTLHVEYHVRNTTRRRSPSLTIVDQLAGRTTRTRLGSLSKRETKVIESDLPARRRGIHRVGPGYVERTDPFWFAVGRRTELRDDEVIVHPRVHPIEGPFGSLHNVAEEAISRSIASDPLSGFVSMRDYVEGDDPRMIHWPTTARTGSLMVREHVELRRPEFAIVIDAAHSVASPDDFEEMVDVAASLAVHALRTGVHVRVATTNPGYIGGVVPLRGDTEILDFLTPIQQISDAHNIGMGQIIEFTGTTGFFAFVTGPKGPSLRNARLDNIQVIRIGKDAKHTTGIASVASTAAHFAQGWR